MVKEFNGFEISEESLTGIPQDFFREVLPRINDTDLLKLCLYLLWKANMVGDYQIAFTVEDIMLDKVFLGSLNDSGENQSILVNNLLDKTCEMNLLLCWNDEKDHHNIYFINCEAGQKAYSQAKNGVKSSTITLDQIQPSIYKLYEENIGPLTPLIADTLRDAEKTYPTQWIKEAIEIAIENNVRRWRYVESILNRWKKEGRNGTNRRRDKTDYRSYLDD